MTEPAGSSIAATPSRRFYVAIPSAPEAVIVADPVTTQDDSIPSASSSELGG